MGTIAPRPPQPQAAPTRESETRPPRSLPPPPPKDQYVASRSRRKPPVRCKPDLGYRSSRYSDERGPLQTLYENVLNDVWHFVSTCFVLWWEAGGAALVAGVFVYLMVWSTPFGSTPIHKFPSLDFRLVPFLIAVSAALAVCLLYCLPQMLRRQDAVNQRRTQHAALVAERSANAAAQTPQ